MKRIFVALLFLLLFGGSVGAVTFDGAMQYDSGDAKTGMEGLFPSWKRQKTSLGKGVHPEVVGIIGTNRDEKTDGSGSEKLLMLYIPHLINILLKFVAPLIMVAMIYAGVRFIYAGSNEEELTQAKDVFTYTIMGALFVILSYSIMKALYFILSST